MSESHINQHNKMADGLSLAQNNSKHRQMQSLVFLWVIAQIIHDEIALFPGVKAVTNENYVSWHMHLT